MDAFSAIMLIGGLAFFLFGMQIMSDGLRKMAGGKLERTLKKMTSNPFKGILLGAGITIAIQSSSAMTVMLVGLVNSGIMTLYQTISITMGSHIGTTLTAWLLSLTGLESENFFIRMLQPTNFSPLLAFAGVLLIMVSKKGKKKDIGSILCGFAVLMFGMDLMKDSVSPLASMPQFQSILTAFSNPLLGILVGAVFTGIIQSSAASVGILQALSLTGGISYGVAIPIVMGQNIGTCATALISSIGVNKDAKRVAVIHTSINVIGTIICTALLYIPNLFFHFSFMNAITNPVGIAVIHTVFNLFVTAILLPFPHMLEKLSYKIVRDRPGDDKYTFIDERLLNTPAFAVAECSTQASNMARLAQTAMADAMMTLDSFNAKTAERVNESEEQLDQYEDKLGTFLVKLSSKSLTAKDSHTVSKLLHTIGDFERIGDHALNLLGAAQEISDKEILFSAEAQKELATIRNAVKEILDITIEAFCTGNIELASHVEPLEQVIDGLIADTKTHHIDRLRNGACTIELGFVLSDILTNYERTSDHCSNIAVAVIEVENDDFDTHSFLREVKEGNDARFRSLFADYSAKYRI